MSRNALRMICLPKKRKIVYSLRNSNGCWMPLSWSSPLLMRYTETTLSESAEDIIAEIDRVYNRNNAGVDIVIDGDAKSYELCNKIVDEHYSNRNIRCEKAHSGIVITGISGVGKTTLIEGIEKALDRTYSERDEGHYVDSYDNEWYEIDVLYSMQDKAAKLVYDLIEKGDIQALVYCVNAAANRFTEEEEDFVKSVKEQYPEISLVVALTQSYGSKERIRRFADDIEKSLDMIRTIPVLVEKEEIELDEGKIYTRKPFGVNEIIDALLEI